MKFILVPIDFSEATPRVLEEAAKLASAFRAHIALLHVMRGPRPAGDAVERGKRTAQAALEEAAERRLLECKADLLRQGVTAHALRLTGNPATDIAAHAEKLGALCIVMGSHGHTALFELVMGGTASAVLRRAVCPVVIVPAKRISVRTKISRARRRLAAIVKS